MTKFQMPEPFAFFNEGIEYHTKGKTILHQEPTQNLETRWWTNDRPLYTESQMHSYGQQCRDDLIELVKAVHKAKGRYHSQLAMCDLYDACNIPNQRPVK